MHTVESWRQTRWTDKQTIICEEAASIQLGRNYNILDEDLVLLFFFFFFGLNFVFELQLKDHVLFYVLTALRFIKSKPIRSKMCSCVMCLRLKQLFFSVWKGKLRFWTFKAFRQHWSLKLSLNALSIYRCAHGHFNKTRPLSCVLHRWLKRCVKYA